MVNIMAKIIILGLFAVGIAFAQPSIPSGAVAYANLTLNESWSSIASQYVQQNITLNESNYTSYINYNGSIANFEFTYANGTVIPSWIESNHSNQTLVWLNITNTTTNVYLDFFNMTTNMLNSTGTNGTGEAPQLSSTYAEYDNGANVFPVYFNAQTSLSSFTKYDVSALSQATLNGEPVISFAADSSYGWAGFSNPIPSAFIIDGWVYTTQTADIVGFVGQSQTSSDSGYLFGAGTGAGDTYVSISKLTNGGIDTLASTGPENENSWEYVQISYNNGAMAINGGSAPQNFIYSDTATDTAYTSGYVGIGESGSASYNYYRYMFVRPYPPNGVMPSVSFGAVQTVSTTLTANPITPSAPTIDSGQSITLTANPSGGTTYSYQWYTATSSGTCSTSDTAISGATSSTYTASPTSSTYYCYIVIDSASATADSPTDLVSVNSALGTPKVSPSAATYDAGQAITLTSSVSGGTTPYSYQWYNDTSGSGVAISGATSSTYTATAGSGAGTFKYYVKVTDSAYSPASATSATESYVINTALSGGSPTPSAPTIDNGQSITLTANPSGGTTPYSYQWYGGTSSTCSSDTAISGATSSTYTASPTTATYYCYKATDSATTPTSATSETDLITVNSAFGTPTISPSSATYDSGQSITLTASVSGGTTSYTYQWYNDTSGTATAISGATSSTYTATAGSTAQTVKYYVTVTDSATTPESTTSSTDSYVINSALGTPSISPSNPTIDSGQSVTFSSIWSGGTPDYTAKLYSSTTSSCSTSSTLVQTLSSLTSGSASFSSVSPTSTTYYCIFVTDSASTPETTNSVNSEVIVNSALGTPTISPSSATYDSGQTITLTSSISGGTTPYSYQWYNDTTGTATAISGATSSSFTETAGATAQTVKYYVKVTDSATTPETTTSATESYIVNTALSGGSPTPTTPTIDDGQSITLTANPSGGTTSYSYQWYSGTSSTCTSDTAISGATSSTYSASPTSSTYYCYTVKDSATTPETDTSATNLITVNSALTASISVSSTTVSIGQNFILTATGSGGTTPYSYQWYNLTSGSAIAISGATSSTLTITSATSGIFKYNATVTDSAYNPETVSTATETITVNPTVSISPLSTILDVPQSVTLTSSSDGAISYQWYNDTTGTPQAISGATSSTLTVQAVSTGTFEYYLTVYGNNSTSANSANATITVNSALGTPSISPSNPTIDYGQSITFTSTWVGGTPDYTAKLYSSSTSTCNTGSTLVQTLSSLTSGSASFSSVSPASTTYYCIFVTDSASTPETNNSINSEVVVIVNLTAIISPASATYYVGQAINLKSSVLGGTPPYTYQWYNDTTGTPSPISGANSSSLTITAVTIGTYEYFVSVTDSTPKTANSTNATIIIFQKPLPLLSNITPAYAILNQTQTFSVYVSDEDANLTNITWAFTQYNASGYQTLSTVYLEDIATTNATNYQQYTFNQTGYGTIIAMACDANSVCNETQITIPIELASPPSYWSAVPQYSSTLAVQAPENLTLELYPNNDANDLGTVGIDWGDNTTPAEGSFMPNGVYGNPYQASYIHNYQHAGNYTISIKVCDTKFNCNTQYLNVSVVPSILYITDLTSIPQAISTIGNNIANSTFLTNFSRETGTNNNYESFGILALISVLGLSTAIWVMLRAIEKPIGA